MKNPRSLALAPALLATGVLLLAPPAFAQPVGDSVEISPTVGWMFGGELSGIDESVDVDDHLGAGLRVGFNVADHFGIEIGYLRERADLVLQGGLDGPDIEVGEIDLDTLDGSLLFTLGGGHFRPFIVLGGGVTRVDLAGADDNRVNVSIGGGFKAFVSPHFGFRFDARRRWTFLDEIEDEDDCEHSCTDDALGQTEVSTGLVFAF